MNSFINSSKRASSSNSKSLKTKLNNFEIKYEEFVNNCSAYLRASDSVLPSRPRYVETYRENRNDSSVSREVVKLKRQNEILMKTVEEINRQERSKSRTKEEFEVGELKEKLKKSEEMVLVLRAQVEGLGKVRNEAGEGKKSASLSGRGLARGKGVSKERNFTPVERKAVSPIYTTVPQKSRERHSLKKQVLSLQTELEKMKSERDQLKIFKKLSKNPPMPASLSLISSQYETEVQKSQAINSIFQKNLERLSRLVKDYIKESTELIPFKRIKELDSLKMKIFEVIRDNDEVRTRVVGKRNRFVRSSLDKVGVNGEGKEGSRICVSAPITVEGFFDSRVWGEIGLVGELSGGTEWKEGIMVWNDLVSKEFDQVFRGVSGFAEKIEKVFRAFGKLVGGYRKILTENKESKREIQELKRVLAGSNEKILVLEKTVAVQKDDLGRSEVILKEYLEKVMGYEKILQKNKDENEYLQVENLKKDSKIEDLNNIIEKSKQIQGAGQNEIKKIEGKFLEEVKKLEQILMGKEIELNELKELIGINQKCYEEIIAGKNQDIIKIQIMGDEINVKIEVINKELEQVKAEKLAEQVIFNENIKNKETELLELEEKISEAESKSKALESALNEKIFELKQSNKELNTSNDKIMELEEKNSALSELLNSLQEKTTHYKNLSESKEAELSQFEELFESQNNKILNYEELIHQYQQALKDNEMKKLISDSAEDNLVKQSQGIIEDHEKLIKGQDLEISKLRKQQAELQENLKNSEMVASHTKKELENYFLEIADSQQKLAEYLEELNRFRQINTEQKQLIVKFESDLQITKENLQVETEKNEKIVLELGKTENQININKGIIQEKENFIVELGAKSKDFEDKLDETMKILQEKTSFFEAERNKYNEDLEKLAENLYVKESQLEILIKGETDLKSKIETLSAQLTKQKSAKKSLKSEKISLLAALQVAESKEPEISTATQIIPQKPQAKLLTCHEFSFDIPSKSSLLVLLQDQINEFLITLSEGLNKQLKISDSQVIISLFQQANNLSSHLQSTILNKESEVARKISEIAELKEKISEIDLQLVKSTHDLYTTTEDLKSETTQKLMYIGKFNALQEEFNTLQDYYDSLYSEKIQFIEKCENLQKAEETLKTRLLNEQKTLEDLSLTNDELLEQVKQAKLEIDSIRASNQLQDFNKNKEVSILKDYISKLENLNLSLESNNKKLEDRYKAQLLENSSKSAETEQSLFSKAENLSQLNTSLQETIENLQTSIEKYKEKVNKLENDLQASSESIKSLQQRPKLSICMEFCETFEAITNIMSPISFSSPLIQEDIPELQLSQSLRSQKSDPDLYSSLQSLFLEIEFLIQKKTPDLVLNWCKKILGHGNYILRYQSNDSIISEDSQIIDKEEDEENQDFQMKLIKQGNIIDRLVNKLDDKKERLRLSELNIKTLQGEIRKLDNKIKQEGSIDLEYLRTSVANFSKGLKKIDGDSFKCLQVIQAQLGLKVDQPITGKKWGLFKKK